MFQNSGSNLLSNKYCSLPCSKSRPCFGQLFIYDCDEANKCRSEKNELDADITKLIDNIMRSYNIHAQSYMMMGDESKIQEENARAYNLTIPELKMLFSLKKDYKANRCNLQRHNEVAATFITTSEGEIPEAYVTTVNKNTKHLQQINSIDSNVEPWLYLLFNPHGTRAWHKD